MSRWDPEEHSRAMVIAAKRLSERAVFRVRDLRTIEGIATTTAYVGTHGCSVRSAGVRYALPIPLLHQHEPGRLLGWVTSATVLPSRIEFEAQIANEGLPDADEVWPRIARGAERGVSIAYADDLYAEELVGDIVHKVMRVWRWTELSVCPTGANADAEILRATEGGRLCQAFRPRSKVVRL